MFMRVVGVWLANNKAIRNHSHCYQVDCYSTATIMLGASLLCFFKDSHNPLIIKSGCCDPMQRMVFFASPFPSEIFMVLVFAA